MILYLLDNFAGIDDMTVFGAASRGQDRHMKINVEVDLTPEELRRFMGLPDVGGVQKQMLERFAKGISESAEQREDFLRNAFAGAMAPWQNFFDMVSGVGDPPDDRRDR